jgi:hypothetical protein
MKLTKNDLSFNKVEIDHNALVSSLQIGIRLLREDINKLNSTLLNDLMECGEHTHYGLTAERIAGDTRELRLLCESLDTILGMRSRRYTKIVNKLHNNIK